MSPDRIRPPRLVSAPRALIATAALAGTLAGCGAASPDSGAAGGTGDRDLVATSFYPLTYFAERLGGDLVEVECPVPPDADPIYWRPTRAAMALYRDADLIVLNGADFEQWSDTAALPRSRTVETADVFAERFLTMETTTHSHGPAGAHTHEGTDGHTWVDPLNALAQAEALAEAMAGAFPEHAGAFTANLAPLRDDLAGLHDAIAAIADDVRAASVVASHPAYGYLEDRHDWSIPDLDLDPEAELDDDDLASIRDAVAEARSMPGVAADAPVILLWESEPLDATVARLREALGVRSVTFAPAESLDPLEAAKGVDYLSIMRGNVDRLAAALRR